MTKTALALLLVVGCSCGEDPKPRPTPAPYVPRAPDEIDAWTMTKDFVTKNLKAPSTANFGSVLGEYQDPRKACVALGGREWRCKGWVDAQNGFGAMLRSNFEVVVWNTDGDHWKLKEYEFDGVKLLP